MYAVADILEAKRDRAPITPGAISWLIRAYAAGDVADAQMAAFCMAVAINGMPYEETSELCCAMASSGVQLSWDNLVGSSGSRVVDKHSTGGVGDKVSLILAPLLASAGFFVPMFSGRGLGITGGTLDKLESIPGLQTQLDTKQLRRQLASIGCFIAGASADLAPADARLYALRDQTGTVRSHPLIASSIMAKKIAGGARTLLVDVKVGLGALCKTLPEAQELANLLVSLGSAAGVRTSCVLTSMDWLLGNTAGNACEVNEAVEVLSGGGPVELRMLTAIQASLLATAAGVKLSADEFLRIFDSGAARGVFQAMVEAQGGALNGELPIGRIEHLVRAERAGTLLGLSADMVGRAVWHAGGGRVRRRDRVDPSAGLTMLMPRGSTVARGDVVAKLYGSSQNRVEAGSGYADRSVLVTGEIATGAITGASGTGRVLDWVSGGRVGQDG
jgi:thymidine phosphorylase